MPPKRPRGSRRGFCSVYRYKSRSRGGRDRDREESSSGSAPAVSEKPELSEDESANNNLPEVTERSTTTESAQEPKDLEVVSDNINNNLPVEAEKSGNINDNEQEEAQEVSSASPEINDLNGLMEEKPDDGDEKEDKEDDEKPIKVVVEKEKSKKPTLVVEEKKEMLKKPMAFSKRGWVEVPELPESEDDEACPGPSGRCQQQTLSSKEMAEKMKSVFQNGLDILLDKREMYACRAVRTELFPHQRAALAWMFTHENTVSQGLRGGILADDMGLGKSLSIIALIMTNHWDGMPLCKPELGHTRRSFLDMKEKRKVRVAPKLTAKQLGVGTKIGGDKKKIVGVGGIFQKFMEKEENSSSSDSESEGETRAFSFGCRSKKVARLVEEETESDRDFINDDSETDIETDEDDEDFDCKLNLDGNLDASSSEEEEIKPKMKKRKMNEVLPSSDEEIEDSKQYCQDSDGLPSPEKTDRRVMTVFQSGPSKSSSSSVSATQSSSVTPQPCSVSSSASSSVPVSGAPRVCPIQPPRQAAQRRGRRRPTLLVCPTSLISHWLEQFEAHLHEGVSVRLKVHHGSSKVERGEELEEYDVVITSYGTLAAETGARGHSPLLAAKWLRVVLDEGHMIKNHRSKTSKAAMQLQTHRRWIVTGTPIQNNLLEFWSLLNWLDFGLYAGYMAHYKCDIVRPCIDGDPRGFERLQMVIDAVCLRRTKTDKKPDGSALVALPVKSLHRRSIKLTEEERYCYNSFYDQARAVVSSMNKRGNLLGNYAHIFALMMRLRQLCCHRELVQIYDWDKILRDREQEEDSDDQDEGKKEESEVEKRLRQQLREMIRSGVTDDCSICLQDLNTPVITACSHVYCRACIETYCRDRVNPPCPLCREPTDVTKLLEAGQDDEAVENGEAAADLEDLRVEISSSKVNAVLEEMIRIRAERPQDKMIVVSQFTSFLSVVQPLLKENGFSLTRLDGTMSHPVRAEVIRVFQSQGKNSPNVLLLSLKAGGVGLNLTAANHLLLLDPAWNPASEWQCFDRIHRMGQTKDVNIYKFITEDSIEEQMLDIQNKKENLINGAFHMPEDERRRNRIRDIKNIFKI